MLHRVSWWAAFFSPRRAAQAAVAAAQAEAESLRSENKTLRRQVRSEADAVSRTRETVGSVRATLTDVEAELRNAKDRIQQLEAANGILKTQLETMLGWQATVQERQWMEAAIYTARRQAAIHNQPVQEMRLD